VAALGGEGISKKNIAPTKKGPEVGNCPGKMANYLRYKGRGRRDAAYGCARRREKLSKEKPSESTGGHQKKRKVRLDTKAKIVAREKARCSGKKGALRED